MSTHPVPDLRISVVLIIFGESDWDRGHCFAADRQEKRMADGVFFSFRGLLIWAPLLR